MDEWIDVNHHFISLSRSIKVDFYREIFVFSIFFWWNIGFFFGGWSTTIYRLYGLLLIFNKQKKKSNIYIFEAIYFVIVLFKNDENEIKIKKKKQLQIYCKLHALCFSQQQQTLSLSIYIYYWILRFFFLNHDNFFFISS